jgi:hypothetical protein
MKECLGAFEKFVPIRDAPTPPEDWVPTRYEQKAIQADRKPIYMSYRWSD